MTRKEWKLIGGEIGSCGSYGSYYINFGTSAVHVYDRLPRASVSTFIKNVVRDEFDMGTEEGKEIARRMIK
jgi:hypothetical protein